MKHSNERKLKTILIAGFLLVGISLNAQLDNSANSPRPGNDININLLGDGSLISLNYERLLVNNPNFFIASKLGVGYNEEFKLNICLFGPCSPASSSSEKYLTIPHHITGNWGARSLFFEFGLGGTALIGGSESNYIVYPLLGFRVQPRNIQKMNFRLFGCFPLGSVEVGGNEVLFFPLGLSLGYCF